MNKVDFVKYIFLDIDGVLATSAQFFSKKRHEKYDCYRFDKKCVDIFNEILEKTNPKIVLSSDWKYHYNIEEMDEIFKWNGVNCEIDDYTPSLWGIDFHSLDELERCRATEIIKYVNDNKIDHWIAIDDLNLNDLLPENNFIYTPRPNEGIKQTNIKTKILNRLL